LVVEASIEMDLCFFGVEDLQELLPLINFCKDILERCAELEFLTFLEDQLKIVALYFQVLLTPIVLDLFSTIYKAQKG
jgi:hypothetical protein